MSKILIIMGVSGSGKTTLGKALAKKFNYRFLEGDLFHSDANKNKMKQGIPLTDTDRLPWLNKINHTLLNSLDQEVVVACSALKKEYRAILSSNLPKDTLLWVYLNAEYTVLKKRMENRSHFMPVSLLESQLELLEPPKGAIALNSSHSVEQMIEQLKTYLND
ncbi:gluconokinase [Flavobacteriaceae bacterium]|nr:gluconokinase [Flavobacteriaceae bacterium]